jgi:hypothetical protein
MYAVMNKEHRRRVILLSSTDGQRWVRHKLNDKSVLYNKYGSQSVHFLNIGGIDYYIAPTVNGSGIRVFEFGDNDTFTSITIPEVDGVRNVLQTYYDADTQTTYVLTNSSKNHKGYRRVYAIGQDMTTWSLVAEWAVGSGPYKQFFPDQMLVHDKQLVLKDSFRIYRLALP